MNNSAATPFLKQLNEILVAFEALKRRAVHQDLSGNTTYDEIAELLTRSRSAVFHIAGNQSQYHQEMQSILDTGLNYGPKLIRIIGVIKALKYDLENGYLRTYSDLIHADIFSDYLEMAAYFVSEGFKDSAAVIAGATLESHLRELCKTGQIAIEIVQQSGKTTFKKAEQMNVELAKAQRYSMAFQKQITAWLEIRNNAAHGKYTLYGVEEVRLMVHGIRIFLLKIPA